MAKPRWKMEQVTIEEQVTFSWVYSNGRERTEPKGTAYLFKDPKDSNIQKVMYARSENSDGVRIFFGEFNPHTRAIPLFEWGPKYAWIDESAINGVPAKISIPPEILKRASLAEEFHLLLERRIADMKVIERKPRGELYPWNEPQNT